MGIALSTIGVKVFYGYGADEATIPSSFTQLKDIVSTPDFNVEPNGIDVTTLDETVAHRYVEGLRDYGTSVQFTANLTTELISTWNGIVEKVEAEKKKESGGTPYLWIEIVHPDLDQAVFIPTQPIALGLPAMEVDSAMQTTLYCTPQAGAQWDDPITE